MLKIALSLDYAAPRMMLVGSERHSSSIPYNCALLAPRVADFIESGRTQPQGSTHALGRRSGE